MLEPKPVAPLPLIGYSLENKEDSRAAMLKTAKKLLDLPNKDVFLDIEVRFRHTDVFTTQVISSVTLVKGPQEKTEESGEPLKKPRPKMAEKIKKKKKNKTNEKTKPKEAKKEQAVIRAIPTGEFYAVQTLTQQKREQLPEEENAVYETGDREDATANDTRSWETGSQKSAPDGLLQLQNGGQPIEIDDKSIENKKVTTTTHRVARSLFTKSLAAQSKEEEKIVAVEVQTTPERHEPVQQPLLVLAPVEQPQEKQKDSPSKTVAANILLNPAPPPQPEEEKKVIPVEVPPKKEEVVSQHLSAPSEQLKEEKAPVVQTPPKKEEVVSQYLFPPLQQPVEEKKTVEEIAPPKKAEIVSQHLPALVEPPKEEKKPVLAEDVAKKEEVTPTALPEAIPPVQEEKLAPVEVAPQKEEVASKYLLAPGEQLKEMQTPVLVKEPAPAKKDELVSQYLPVPVEEAKEEKKPALVEPPPKKEEPLPKAVLVEPAKEEKKLVSIETQTSPKVTGPPAPAAGWMEMKTGAKGKTETLLTVRVRK